MKILLPMCPSVNALFGTNFNTKKRFKSKKYEDWIELANTYKNPTAEYKGGLTTISFKFFSSWHTKEGKIRIKDLDNFLKAPTDYLKSKIRNFDDSSIFKIEAEKIESDREEVEITIN